MTTVEHSSLTSGPCCTALSTLLFHHFVSCAGASTSYETLRPLGGVRRSAPERAAAVAWGGASGRLLAVQSAGRAVELFRWDLTFSTGHLRWSAGVANDQAGGAPSKLLPYQMVATSRGPAVPQAQHSLSAVLLVLSAIAVFTMLCTGCGQRRRRGST